MAEIKIVRMSDIPEIDCGEIHIYRPAGGKTLMLSAKSAAIATLFRERSAGKMAKFQWIDQSFQGWAISSEFSRPGVYAFNSTADPYTGDLGGGTSLTFLLHPDLEKGIELPINNPVDASSYARHLGEALGRFIEDHLAPFREGYRFYFEKV
jgi:hypothetical protein